MRLAATVAELTMQGQCLLEVSFGLIKIAHLEQEIAQIIQCFRSPAPVLNFVERRERLLIHLQRTRQVTEPIKSIREVPVIAGQSPWIIDLMIKGQCLPEIGLSIAEFALTIENIADTLESGANAPLSPNLFEDRKRLFVLLLRAFKIAFVLEHISYLQQRSRSALTIAGGDEEVSRLVGEFNRLRRLPHALPCVRFHFQGLRHQQVCAYHPAPVSCLLGKRLLLFEVAQRLSNLGLRQIN